MTLISQSKFTYITIVLESNILLSINSIDRLMSVENRSEGLSFISDSYDQYPLINPSVEEDQSKNEFNFMEQDQSKICTINLPRSQIRDGAPA